MVLLIFVSIFILASCTPPPSLEEGDFTLVKQRILPELSLDSNNNFDIFVLSDTHFLGYGKNDKNKLRAIEKEINDFEYELVIITGDMLEGYNKKSKYNKLKAIQDIANIFENNKQYWAFVAGNNDGEYCGNKQAIFAELVKYKYCLVADRDVGGVGNYFIDIIKDNDLFHRLIFMDSGMRDENGNLQTFCKSQIDWYEKVVNDTIAQNAQSSLYIHIPFKESISAYENGVVIDTYNNFLETKDINVHDDSSKMYDKIASMKNTKLIVSGHTHSQDFARLYNDIYWLQVRAFGYGVYNNGLPNGGARVTINSTEKSYEFSKINLE